MTNKNESDPDHDPGRAPGPADGDLFTRETPPPPSGESCCPAHAYLEAQPHPPHPSWELCCWAHAELEAEGRMADEIDASKKRRRASRAEWHRLFDDLEALRRALTRALPGLADLEVYWKGREEDVKRGELFPQAEWAVREWLFSVGPADRAAMEELTRALYWSQIAVLARYADLDRLAPDVRARVEAGLAAALDPRVEDDGPRRAR